MIPGAKEFPRLLQQALETHREAVNFEAGPWIEQILDKTEAYFRNAGLKAAAINVSGGIDSAVTLALLHRLMNRDNSPLEKIVPICQPIHSTEKIINRADLLCDYLKLELFNVDQTAVFDMLAPLVSEALHVERTQFADGQLKSCMRTPVAYYAAHLMNASGYPCLVVGTGNYDEDGYLRYFTKAGDGTVDIQLISELHKSQVYSVARSLDLPDFVCDAIPSADLWEGQTDEDELGCPYEFIEFLTGAYLQWDEDKQKDFIATLENEDPVSHKCFNEWYDLASSVHRRSAHKAFWPVNIVIKEPPKF
ncbi:hypothetical protein PCE1_001589 [Barthelona sp. PCE]